MGTVLGGSHSKVDIVFWSAYWGSRGYGNCQIRNSHLMPGALPTHVLGQMLKKARAVHPWGMA